MQIIQGNFVLFKKPFHNHVELWLLDKKPIISKDFFYIQSFDNKYGIKLHVKQKFQFNIQEINILKFNIQLKKDEYFPNVFTQDEYLSKADLFINNLKNHELDKVILSRVKEEKHISDYNEKFEFLCEKYPSAFVYFTHFDGETWMGSTPEKLLISTEKGLETVALAGTKSKKENRDWLEKEYKEHDYVVKYITGQFNSENIICDGPKTIELGDIQHLKTDIFIHQSETDIPKILQKLHPTPAVCGLPKQKSKDFILENEEYDRSFYTGFLGIQTQETTAFFVNLRCMQLFENKTAVYVGGGLIAESNPHSEWQETELKAKALF